MANPKKNQKGRAEAGSSKQKGATPLKDSVTHLLDDRRRREPTGINLLVIISVILYWALGGSYTSLRNLFAFGALYYTCA